MHISALANGKKFFETYCQGDFLGKSIVDIGAQNVNGSLKDVAPVGAKYIGVDFVRGAGVDVVLEDPYSLPFENDTIDIVVCSSVFEHSDFFWLLFNECIRILKPNGLLYLNVPSNGFVHRYPVDSWRFYPDAGLSLVNWSRRSGYNTILLESYISEKNGPIQSDGMWNDFVAVILKDDAYQESYPRRILDAESSALCGWRSDVEVAVPDFIQNPDHRIIVGLQDDVAGLEVAISTVEIKLSEREKLISDRDRKLSELMQVSAANAERIDELESVISSIKRSKSWRVTAPFRSIVGLFKRLGF